MHPNHIVRITTGVNCSIYCHRIITILISISFEQTAEKEETQKLIPVYLSYLMHHFNVIIKII